MQHQAFSCSICCVWFPRETFPMSPLLFTCLHLNCKADFKLSISAWNRITLSSLWMKKMANHRKEWPCRHVFLFTLHHSRDKTHSLFWTRFPLTRTFSSSNLTVFQHQGSWLHKVPASTVLSFPLFPCSCGTYHATLLPATLVTSRGMLWYLCFQACLSGHAKRAECPKQLLYQDLSSSANK